MVEKQTKAPYNLCFVKYFEKNEVIFSQKMTAIITVKQYVVLW